VIGDIFISLFLLYFIYINNNNNNNNKSSQLVPCRDYLWTICFKNCKNTSTHGEVMSKIKVVCFF